HINPLDECHGSRITLALAKLHDTRVSTIAIRRSWRDVIEQFLHRKLLAQRRQSGAPSVNRAIFSECDHAFGERPNCLRLRQRGLDALMFNQGTNLISQQRLSVLSRATEFDRLFLVSHNAANVILEPALTLRQVLRWDRHHRCCSPEHPEGRVRISCPGPTEAVVVY